MSVFHLGGDPRVFLLTATFTSVPRRWGGMPLRQTSAYGVRLYQNGSSLVRDGGLSWASAFLCLPMTSTCLPYYRSRPPLLQ